MKTLKQVNKYYETIKQYALNNNLEIVFNINHRLFDVIFYDVIEGKYYNRETDLYITLKQYENMI